MSNAEKIFNELRLNKYEEIKAFVNPPGKEENLYLDFKEKENSKTPDLSDSDKRNYSIALSGFANSAGGVIVWGVKCAKTKERDIDTASELKPISCLRQFMSNLNDITGDAVSPLVEGIIHEEIHIPNESDSGFLVTLISESVASPHRAEIKGTKQYYKRVGDSFYPMEHYDLEDMFGRRKKPRLFLEIQLSNADINRGRSTSEDRVRLTLTVSISNRGKAVAKYPFLSLSLPSPYYVSQYGIDGNRNHGLRLLPDSDSQDSKFGGSADQVIHQDTSLGITEIEANIRNLESISDLCIRYRLGAEDVKTVEDTYLIKGDEIKEFLKKQIPDLSL